MNLEEYFHSLISGQRRGISADVQRGLLCGCEFPYATAMRFRNFLYDHERLHIGSVNVPVISVGNLTLGGTGKTPLVAHLTQWALSQKIRPGLISRGYQKGKRVQEESESSSPFSDSTGQRLNDEGMELAIRFPNVPHLQSPNRFAVATRMVRDFRTEMLILDDAFQHRRMKRDLDIVLLDSREPFGYGHIFPRGLLRESVSSLSRAQIVLLSRADLVSGSRRQEIRKQVEKLAPNAIWGEIVHRPITLISYYQSDLHNDSQLNSEKSGFFGQKTASLDFLAGKRVFAFAGIAKPDSFRKTILDCRAEIVRFNTLTDHHEFTTQEIDRLAEEAKQSDAEVVLCTMKDLVKIHKRALGKKELWALAIGIEFLHGEAEFTERLRSIVKQSNPLPLEKGGKRERQLFSNR